MNCLLFHDRTNCLVLHDSLYLVPRTVGYAGGHGPTGALPCYENDELSF